MSHNVNNFYNILHFCGIVITLSSLLIDTQLSSKSLESRAILDFFFELAIMTSPVDLHVISRLRLSCNEDYEKRNGLLLKKNNRMFRSVLLRGATYSSSYGKNAVPIVQHSASNKDNARMNAVAE